MLKLPSGEKIRMLTMKNMIIWKQTSIIGVIIISTRWKSPLPFPYLTTRPPD